MTANFEGNRYADDQSADSGELDHEIAEMCAPPLSPGHATEKVAYPPTHGASAHFNDLATELKLQIFEDLLQNGSGLDILNASLVCKDWDTICTSLLWTDVRVDNDNLVPFMRSLHWAREGTGAALRTISLSINMCDFTSDMKFKYQLRQEDLVLYGPVDVSWASWLIGNPFDQKTFDETWVNWEWLLHCGLPPLQRVLKEKVLQLQTFSFRLLRKDARSTRSLLDDREADTNIPLSDISKVLESLPKTCHSLEVDLADPEVTARPQDIRGFGNSLIRILPQLHHFRLRTCYASTFYAYLLSLQSVLPLLESFSLDLTLIDHSLAEENHPSYRHRGLGLVGPQDLEAIRALVDKLRQDYEKNLFPNAETVLVHTDGMNCPTVAFHTSLVPYRRYRIDIVSNSTEVISKCDAHSCIDNDDGTRSRFQAFALVQDNRSIWYFDKQAFLDVLDPTWVTAKETGVRLPAQVCIKKRQSCLQQGLSFEQVMAKEVQGCESDNSLDWIAEEVEDWDRQLCRICLSFRVEGLCGSLD